MNRYGDAVEAYTYKPFGETAIYSIASGVFTQETTSPLGNVFQFTSQFHDVESSLYHFRARAYSVSLGRFLQRDPAGYVDGANLYSYVRNSPLRFIDPTGLIKALASTSGANFSATNNGGRSLNVTAPVDAFDFAFSDQPLFLQNTFDPIPRLDSQFDFSSDLGQIDHRDFSPFANFIPNVPSILDDPTALDILTLDAVPILIGQGLSGVIGQDAAEKFTGGALVASLVLDAAIGGLEPDDAATLRHLRHLDNAGDFAGGAVDATRLGRRTLSTLDNVGDGLDIVRTGNRLGRAAGRGAARRTIGGRPDPSAGRAARQFRRQLQAQQRQVNKARQSLARAHAVAVRQGQASVQQTLSRRTRAFTGNASPPIQSSNPGPMQLKRIGGERIGGDIRVFHGTDVKSALSILNGASLDAARAKARKIDGPPGFFLATRMEDAEFFAARRSPGTVLQFSFSGRAINELQTAGLVRRPIPQSPSSPRFLGDELFVPPDAFDIFRPPLKIPLTGMA